MGGERERERERETLSRWVRKEYHEDEKEKKIERKRVENDWEGR